MDTWKILNCSVCVNCAFDVQVGTTRTFLASRLIFIIVSCRTILMPVFYVTVCFVCVFFVLSGWLEFSALDNFIRWTSS